jgi:hypothetical protein
MLFFALSDNIDVLVWQPSDFGAFLASAPAKFDKLYFVGA